MFKVKAKIELFKGESVRQTPICRGYRPLFDFHLDSLYSGSIQFDGNEISPGERENVLITFVINEIKGSLSVGQKFYFTEGANRLGQGEILEVI
jgi:translation elongation factor EF-Tu-like GTPase